MLEGLSFCAAPEQQESDLAGEMLIEETASETHI